jgi:hypothetical protein
MTYDIWHTGETPTRERDNVCHMSYLECHQTYRERDPEEPVQARHRRVQGGQDGEESEEEREVVQDAVQRRAVVRDDREHRHGGGSLRNLGLLSCGKVPGSPSKSSNSC